MESALSGSVAAAAAVRLPQQVTFHSKGGPTHAAAPECGSMASMAAVTPTTATAQSPRRKADGILAFAEHPDRLLCDPTNAVWVYGKYEYRYTVTESQSRAHGERLVRRMVRHGLDHYHAAVAAFGEMSAEAQRAHVLRGVPAQVLPAMQSAAPPTSSRSRGSIAPRASLTRSRLASVASFAALAADSRDAATSLMPDAAASVNIHAVPRVTEEEVYAAMRRTWPAALPGAEDTRSGGGEGAEAGRRSMRLSFSASAFPQGLAASSTVPHAAASVSSSSTLPPRLVYPKVKLVIDLVVSRKSLGESPVTSKPYQLSQHLYRHAAAHYAESVSFVCVGMTDASIKLACRDVLFPFRQHALGLPVSGGALFSPAATAPLTSATRAGGGRAPSIQWSGPRMSLPGLPPCSRLPPLAPEQLDQCRMFICYDNREASTTATAASVPPSPSARRGH